MDVKIQGSRVQEVREKGQGSIRGFAFRIQGLRG